MPSLRTWLLEHGGCSGAEMLADTQKTPRQAVFGEWSFPLWHDLRHVNS